MAADRSLDQWVQDQFSQAFD